MSYRQVPVCRWLANRKEAGLGWRAVPVNPRIASLRGLRDVRAGILCAGAVPIIYPALCADTDRAQNGSRIRVLVLYCAASLSDE